MLITSRGKFLAESTLSGPKATCSIRITPDIILNVKEQFFHTFEKIATQTPPKRSSSRIRIELERREARLCGVKKQIQFQLLHSWIVLPIFLRTVPKD